jgi:glycosyltransferase involved in cell wall biosynthesis
MHVLFVSHYTLPHAGGIEAAIDELGRLLVQQGLRVTVISSRTNEPAEEERDGMRIIRVPAWNFLERAYHVPYPIFSPALLTALWRAVRAADVVHAHGVLYLSSLWALFCAWWMGKPFVVTEHVGFVLYRNRLLSFIERLALRILTPLFLRRADAVLALNAQVHAWLANLTPYPDRLHFVRNGIDTQRFHPASPVERTLARSQLGLDATRPVALFVGRFVEKKGLDTLLAATHDEFDLLLCGRGDLALPTNRQAIHVLRDVDRGLMPAVYHAADVFVLPSQGEGFPMAIMEAMASGLPVVAVRDASYDDYVSAAEMVQVAAQANSLRTAVLSITADQAERARRSAAARERAEGDFDISASAAGHAAIYEQARGARLLSNALAPLGHDLASRIKLPHLRALIGNDPPTPYADIGPGSGFIAHHVFGPGPIIAIDISRANLVTLRSRAQEAGCEGRFMGVQGDLSALPFRDGSLGTILCAEVLEHVEQDEMAAAELLRVMAPAGRLVAEVPNAERGYASYLERLGVPTVHTVPGPELHHRPGYSAESLAQLFRPAGGKVTMRRAYAGFLSLLMMDLIAAVHLIYQRLRHGRASWTWSDVQQITNTPIFRLYRVVFPVLRTTARLDAVLWRGVGFILGCRIEKDQCGAAQARDVR